MSRLTRKDYKNLGYYNGYYNKKITTKLEKIYYKLGVLEDLEEELGCPLKVVFEALDVGVCVSCKILDLEEFDTIERPRLYYSDDNKCYCFELLFGEYVVKLKDYQKTWWLKGEKENE